MAPGDVYLEQTNRFWILLIGALTRRLIFWSWGAKERDGRCGNVAMLHVAWGEMSIVTCTKVGTCFFPERNWTSKD